MTSQRKPQEEPSGFETSSELRREYEDERARREEARSDYEERRRDEAERRRAEEERRRRDERGATRGRPLAAGRGWAVVLVAVVVVGLVVYFLVTSL
jgi:hypothetical protein